MEATGIYHEALAEHLHAAGHTVHVFNPAQVAAFARSELARAKTDKVDAKRIARYLAMRHATGPEPRPWQPLSASHKHLRALVSRRDDLAQMLQMEINRKESAQATVHASLDHVIHALGEELKAIEARIRQHIDDDPDLRRNDALLNSIKGVGQTTSALFLARVGDATRFDSPGQLVAHAGLNPAHCQSGTFTGKARISRIGDAVLRAKLYMCAVTGRTHNPQLRALAQRLEAKGKPGKVILCALMRKLLHIIWGVLRSGRPYDPTHGLA